MGFAILYFKWYETFLWICLLFYKSPITFSSERMKLHNQYYHRALRPQFWWWIPYLKEKERKIKLLSWLQFFFNSCWYVCMHASFINIYNTIYNAHDQHFFFFFFHQIPLFRLALWILHNDFWPGFSGSFSPSRSLALKSNDTFFCWKWWRSHYTPFKYKSILYRHKLPKTFGSWFGLNIINIYLNDTWLHLN